MRVLILCESIVSFFLFISVSLADNLNWSDCLKRAQANNLTIQSSKHSLESARYNLKASYFNLLPTLDLSSSYTRSDDINQYDIAYTATLRLPTLTKYYSIKSSKLSLLKAEQNNSDVERGLRSELAKAFVSLAFSHKEAAKLKDIVKRMKKNKKLSEIRFKSGDATTPKYNVQDQEQKYLTYVARLDQNQKDIELKNQILKDLLLDSSATVYQPNIETLNISVPSKDVVLSKIENHPDIKSFKIETEQAELNDREVRSDFLPTLSVSSSYKRSKVFDRKKDEEYIKDDGWMIVATMTLPILSSIETYARTQSSNELYKKSKLNLDQKRLTIKQNIRTSYNEYEKALQDLELAKKDFNIQKTKANIYQRQYEIGKISYDDWSDSQDKLTSSEMNVINAEHNRYISLINLKNNIGE